MLLAATEYVRPANLEEAIDALGSSSSARVLAGGQTLLNVLKHRAASVELLVDVSRLAELRFIDVTPDGSATVGAATTYQELERSAQLRAARDHLPGARALRAAARWVRRASRWTSRSLSSVPASTCGSAAAATRARASSRS